MDKIRWYHILFGLLALLLVVLFIIKVKNLLPPFIIALVIAWLLDPLISRLQSRKCPRVLAVSLVFVVFLGAFAIGLIFLIPVIIDQAKQLAFNFPMYLDTFGEYITDFFSAYKPTLLKLDLPTTFREAMSTYADNLNVLVVNVVKLITDWITANLTKVLWIIIVPLVSFYCLNDMDRIRRKSVLLIPESLRPRATYVLSRLGGVFSNYLRGLLLVCILYGIATGTVLTAVGVKYSVLIGVFAGLFYAVPYIGAILTALLAFLVALVTHDASSLQPIWVPPAVILVMNQAFDLFISPKILGKSVGLHPVISLFAMLAGGQLFGLLGMILAVPLAASIQEIILDLYPTLSKSPDEIPILDPNQPQSKINEQRPASDNNSAHPV